MDEILRCKECGGGRFAVTDTGVRCWDCQVRISWQQLFRRGIDEFNREEEDDG